MESRLELIVGPMYAGKTTELIRRLTSFAPRWRVLYVNSTVDTRTETAISTHNATLTVDESVVLQKVSELGEVDFQDFDVIGIDEAQFFRDLVSGVAAMLRGNRRVIVSGLDGDFLKSPIGQVLELIPWAEDVVKLKANCSRCADRGIVREAPFTMKVRGGAQIEVNDDLYLPVCRQCFTV